MGGREGNREVKSILNHLLWYCNLYAERVFNAVLKA